MVDFLWHHNELYRLLQRHALYQLPIFIVVALLAIDSLIVLVVELVDPPRRVLSPLVDSGEIPNDDVVYRYAYLRIDPSNMIIKYIFQYVVDNYMYNDRVLI